MRQWGPLLLLGIGAVLIGAKRVTMNVKPGVVLSDTISHHIIAIRKAVSDAWIMHDAGTPTITSSYRTTGSGAHARGEAEDYRTFTVDSSLRFVLAADISRALGPLYQAIVEDGTKRWYYRDGRFEGAGTGSRVDAHLHVEYDGGS